MTDFRLYLPEECGKDGYPFAWHGTHGGAPIKDVVRGQAGNRCVRCGHPYRKGEHPMERVEYEVAGETVVNFESWSPCDEHCTHTVICGEHGNARPNDHGGYDALARILTVHHLNQVKADCRWWNLASLCQRCHLRVQRVVVLPRVWPWPHSDWFKPYAAGWYAHAYLGEDLDRAQTMGRLDELLALELTVTG